MNTVGKILVVLITVFALVAGGLLIQVYVTNTNWKKATEITQQENTISRANIEAYKKTYDDQKNRDAAKIARLDDEIRKVKADNDKLKEDLIIKDAAFENEKLKVADALANQKKSEEDSRRFRDENKELLKTVEKRDLDIVRLESEHRKIKNELANEQNRATAAIDRLQGLQERLAVVEKELLLKDLSRNALTNSGGVRDPNQPNPPAVSVSGKISFVDGKDTSLVEITLGTDHGLNKDNTLDVYRLTPRPEWLGMVKIVSADNHRSIGRMMRSAGVSPSPVRIGDSVSSDITRTK